MDAPHVDGPEPTLVDTCRNRIALGCHIPLPYVLELCDEIERLREALDTIAGGRVDRFRGERDVMGVSPLEGGGAMWLWSRRVARAALGESEE